jgi:hypothetical protein
VTDERDVFRDALRRGMGETTYGQVRAAFNGRVEMGEFRHTTCATVHAQRRALKMP